MHVHDSVKKKQQTVNKFSKKNMVNIKVIAPKHFSNLYLIFYVYNNKFVSAIKKMDKICISSDKIDLNENRMKKRV